MVKPQEAEKQSGDVTVNEGGQAIVSHVSHGTTGKRTLIIRAFEALPKGDIVQQLV